MSSSKRKEVFDRLSELGFSPQMMNYDAVVAIAVTNDAGKRMGLHSPWGRSAEWWEGPVDEIVDRFVKGADEFRNKGAE